MGNCAIDFAAAQDAMTVPVVPALPSKDDPIVQKYQQRKDSLPIVIIGAGVSGIFAAVALERMGVTNYVILEASDRIGGRLKDTASTDSTPSVLSSSLSSSCQNSDKAQRLSFWKDGCPLDLGAEWIHARNGQQAVKDMLIFRPEDTEETYDLLEDSNFIPYNPTWQFQTTKAPILQRLYQETKWKRSTWWEYLQKCVVEANGVEDKVRCNAPVTKIAYNPTQHSDEPRAVSLEIDHGRERILASKVICTIPLAVLKIQTAPDSTFFTPPLSDSKRLAITNVRMPPGYRILFEMETRFYPDLTSHEGFWSSIWSNRLAEGDLTFLYDALYGKENENENDGDSRHVLAFVAVGDHHASLSKTCHNEDDLVKDALEKIDEIFEGRGSQNYKSHILQNWTKEPYIQGSYTFAGSSSKKDRLALAEPEYDGMLLFAGEHTSVDFYSLVPGAAMEGRRAAVEAVAHGMC